MVDHHERVRRPPTVRALVIWSAVIFAVASACGSGRGNAEQRREADVYVAALRAALGDRSTTDARPLVFVSPMDGDAEFPLEVQAGVIAELAKEADVKFVDDTAQAIDAGAPGRPVLGGGVLFSLGKVPTSGTDVEVSGERYRTTADRASLRFSVRTTAGGWVAQIVSDQPRPAGG